MHHDLRDFLFRLTGATVMALAPVVFVAFLSMPLSLNRHPGEGPTVGAAAARHMT